MEQQYAEIETKTAYDLLKQMVEGVENTSTLYADRIAALTELNRRRGTIGPHCDPNSEEFAIYRVRGALACYDLQACTPEELRVVVKWARNRFELNLVFWWEDEAPEIDYGGES